MDKIKRREFTGSWLLFLILVMSGFGIPFAILYLLEHTIEIEYQIEDAEKFIEQYVRTNKKWLF